MEENRYLRPFRLVLEEFRNFKNVSIEFGKKLTVISGQNGVGKSNILSLVASGSGLGKKSVLGSNFQPEFYDFFNVDVNENYEDYKMYLQYTENDKDVALTKRLSFKNDIDEGRGIRIIPRTVNYEHKYGSVKAAEQDAKELYGIGGAARVKLPTIYLSLSRLYPLGERKESVEIKEITKKNLFYQKKADEKYKTWYNSIIPNSITDDAGLSMIKKGACTRGSLHMDMLNTPTLSQSIGQDNIGNIVSALVDIYILSLDDDYNGAVLCIDEIDVSLHPDTQIRLLELCDQLSSELSIHFVVSTHSLTILKEGLKKAKKNNMDYKVMYIKNPYAPYVTEIDAYELLKADMFGSLTFEKPKVRIYFEDEVGKELFKMLLKAFREIYVKVQNEHDGIVLRNSVKVYDYNKINDNIIRFEQVMLIEDKVKQIATVLGCENLLQISCADEYFKRVIFMLDGDARHKMPDQKPHIKDYLDKKYDPKPLQLSDRKHTNNICFFPDYFAPESFLYGIIYRLCSNPIEHAPFWRALDAKEETALYTSDKILEMFNGLRPDFNNDDLKCVFKDVNSDSEVWKFVKQSNMLTYFYSDYTTVGELLNFIEKLQVAYNMAEPLTISNRYV